MTTSLSSILRERRPRLRTRPLGEPEALIGSAERIRQRWPDAEAESPETDAEQLARELNRRRRSDDWQGYFWADATRAALAILGPSAVGLLHGPWGERTLFRGLLDFVLEQIAPESGETPARALFRRTYARALWRKYLETWDPDREPTRRLGETLAAHWEEARLPISEPVRRFGVFGAGAPDRIAAFMDDQSSPFGALRAAGIEAPHGLGLMAAAHSHFVARLAERIAAGDPVATDKLLRWLNPPEATSVLEAGAGKAIDALLLPWRNEPPDPALRKRIQTGLVAAYGDPRVKSAGVWFACTPAARSVVLHWLAGETIEVFFDIVTRAVAGAEGSHMWPDRRAFWTGLHKDGRVAEAWFALSRAGERAAEERARGSEGLHLDYARNKSKSTQDREKCLLLMNVDDRWVVEGSHNFRVHVFPRSSRAAVTLYRQSYTCGQFRYYAGPGTPERIPHIGDWQNKVLRVLLG